MFGHVLPSTFRALTEARCRKWPSWPASYIFPSGTSIVTHPVPQISFPYAHTIHTPTGMSPGLTHKKIGITLLTPPPSPSGGVYFRRAYLLVQIYDGQGAGAPKIRDLMLHFATYGPPPLPPSPTCDLDARSKRRRPIELRPWCSAEVASGRGCPP